jgi:hypothetical protein
MSSGHDSGHAGNVQSTRQPGARGYTHRRSTRVPCRTPQCQPTDWEREAPGREVSQAGRGLGRGAGLEPRAVPRLGRGVIDDRSATAPAPTLAGTWSRRAPFLEAIPSFQTARWAAQHLRRTPLRGGGRGAGCLQVDFEARRGAGNAPIATTPANPEMLVARPPAASSSDRIVGVYRRRPGSAAGAGVLFDTNASSTALVSASTSGVPVVGVGLTQLGAGRATDWTLDAT